LLDEIQHGLDSYSVAPSPGRGAILNFRMTAFARSNKGNDPGIYFIGQRSWNRS
jgi:hypothetical protein